MYYKDTDNKLHFLDSAEFEYLLPLDSILITNEEAATIQAEYLASLPGIPDVQGFTQALKTALGGIIGANAIAVAYPLFFTALQTSEWDDVQALLIDAKTKTLLTTDQYAEIKTLAETYNIPINL
jgi:hypothetical protein